MVDIFDTVDTVDTVVSVSVSARVVETCELMLHRVFVHGGCELSAELMSVGWKDKRMDGHPHREMLGPTRILAVPSAVNSTAVTTNMLARPPKRPTKRKM